MQQSDTVMVYLHGNLHYDQSVKVSKVRRQPSFRAPSSQLTAGSGLTVSFREYRNDSIWAIQASVACFGCRQPHDNQLLQ